MFNKESTSYFLSLLLSSLSTPLPLPYKCIHSKYSKENCFGNMLLWKYAALENCFGNMLLWKTALEIWIPLFINIVDLSENIADYIGNRFSFYFAVFKTALINWRLKSNPVRPHRTISMRTAQHAVLAFDGLFFIFCSSESLLSLCKLQR